jgi:hypothetical protein
LSESVITTAKLSKEFRAWASVLGHEMERIEAGEEVTSYIEVPSMEAARNFSHATAEQRAERLKTYFHPAIAMRSRLGQGFHDRGEAFILADGPGNPADEHGLNVHLPLHFKAISVERKTVAAGEIWDVSVRGDIWDLDSMEELYCAVNVGTLVLERGASLAIRGNAFLLLCQEVIAAEDSRICILPTPFSVDYGTGPMRGEDGGRGADGTCGGNGQPMRTGGSILGPTLAEEIEPEQLDGGDGTDGAPGGRGADGRNGGMSKVAELTLRHMEGVLTIYACAGAGGDGGNGGDGGHGGDGGDGSDGGKVVSGIFAGGNGGRGGKGGAGGRGGHGGSGGLSSNIYVNVPPHEEGSIVRISLPSPAGECGRGGRGGSGGRGGAAGKGHDVPYDGLPGTPGEAGADGKPGANGRSRPAPVIFLNEKV